MYGLILHVARQQQEMTVVITAASGLNDRDCIFSTCCRRRGISVSLFVLKTPSNARSALSSSRVSFDGNMSRHVIDSGWLLARRLVD